MSFLLYSSIVCFSKLGQKIITNETMLHQIIDNWEGEIFTKIQNNSLVKIKTNF